MTQSANLAALGTNVNSSGVLGTAGGGTGITAFGTGVATALGSNVTGSGGIVLTTSPTLVTPALGTPSSGIVTNLTGTASININGTVGATTPATGAFTTLAYTGTLTGGTGVVNLGSGQFYKDASGNVGIGTSSPSAAHTLSVVGAGIYTNGPISDFGSGLYSTVRINASGNNAIFGFALDGTQGGAYNGRDWRIEQGRNTVGNFNITEIVSGNPIRLSINGSGNVGLTGSNASANGVGICFPATQSASSNANTLDDYEEGTWTPAVTSLSGSITSYTASGTYIKIGKQITVSGVVTVVTAGTASGGLTISNMPFAPGSLPSTFSSNFQNSGLGRSYFAGVYYQFLTLGLSATAFMNSLPTYGSGIAWSSGESYQFNITYLNAD